MRLTSINSAEAIFEPFFDEHLSELCAWHCDAPGATGVSQVRGWAFVTFQWTMPAPDGLVLRMQRTYEPPVPCVDYDRLLVCFNLAEETVMSITAETDAGVRQRTTAPAGATRREEGVDRGAQPAPPGRLGLDAVDRLAIHRPVKVPPWPMGRLR
jgi:hypothetical protein